MGLERDVQLQRRGRQGRQGLRNRRQTGLGIASRWRVGVNLPVESDVTRARPGAHDRIAFLYMAQRSTLEIETVDEHAVGAEVCGKHAQTSSCLTTWLVVRSP